MTDPVRRVRTKTFDHTISGLLTKRAALQGEAVEARARQLRLRVEITAIDRVLGSLGYTGDLNALKPRRRRETLFQRGQLTRTLLTVLRDADEPMMGREITLTVLRRLGRAVPDDATLADRTRRSCRVLRALESEGTVLSGLDGHGRRLWSLAHGTGS